MKTPESKAQLAALYAPCLSERGALKRLQAWIDFNPRLARALERAGFRKRQKLLTPRQVDIIYKYLGEP
ncbi:MAG: DUF4248 domain-containing protein [Oscillospiraceae bacterium]|jgi:hypothetical protein|nr:DUF4248 domain-containing protein [Oscillospiraceae bacterium]